MRKLNTGVKTARSPDEQREIFEREMERIRISSQARAQAVHVIVNTRSYLVEYSTRAAFYEDVLGLSPSQGTRLQKWGEMLEALGELGKTVLKVESHARKLRKFDARHWTPICERCQKEAEGSSVTADLIETVGRKIAGPPANKSRPENNDDKNAKNSGADEKSADEKSPGDESDAENTSTTGSGEGAKKANENSGAKLGGAGKTDAKNAGAGKKSAGNTETEKDSDEKSAAGDSNNDEAAPKGPALGPLSSTNSSSETPFCVAIPEDQEHGLEAYTVDSAFKYDLIDAAEAPPEPLHAAIEAAREAGTTKMPYSSTETHVARKQWRVLIPSLTDYSDGFPTEKSAAPRILMADRLSQLANTARPDAMDGTPQGMAILAPGTDALEPGVPNVIIDHVVQAVSESEWPCLLLSKHLSRLEGRLLPHNLWVGARASRKTLARLEEQVEVLVGGRGVALYTLGAKDLTGGIPLVDGTVLDWIVVEPRSVTIPLQRYSAMVASAGENGVSVSLRGEQAMRHVSIPSAELEPLQKAA